MTRLTRLIPQILAVFVAAIFLDSLRYKFTDHPNTQEIFGRLDAWAASFGAQGLFAKTGLFSQYAIGSAELLASAILILTTLFPRYRLFQPIGAAIGLAIMTGAINFHLFTPLSIDPNDDGGGLFVAACLVWLSCGALLSWRGAESRALARRFGEFMRPAYPAEVSRVDAAIARGLRPMIDA